VENGDHWKLFVELVQAIWTHVIVPRQMLWSIVVLIPKGGGDYWGIGLLEPIWKVLERIIDRRLDAVELHDCLHGYCAHRETGTRVIEAKLAQQLSYLELKPFFGVFFDLKKAFDSMDWERCIMILEGYGADPRMIRLIRGYWSGGIMVCRASGNYGTPFKKAGHGVTQGGPRSAKLFNILVDAVTCEWFRELREGGDYEEWERDKLMSAFFAIFYVDDAYLASRDAEFLQHMLDLLVSLFVRVGLETNTSKTQRMICTPGRIRTQLPTDSYRRLQRGRVTATEWNARDIECFKCGKTMKASSLRRHLVDMHNVYQQTVVAEEMLVNRPAKTYVVSDWSPAGLSCPFPKCGGLLSSGWTMRRHFRDVHPIDLVKVPEEGKFHRCTRCRMQVNPRYPRHWFTKECQEQMIAVYVGTRPILTECRRGERKRGAVPHRWWWEQQMDLDVNDATGSDE